MTDWRPPDWVTKRGVVTITEGSIDLSKPLELDFAGAFEAGASAMLEALKKQGRPIWGIDRQFKGYSCFIPAPGEVADLDTEGRLIPDDSPTNEGER